ncbi:MAG: ACP S-malonyltransferase, partial [Gammaproteobacteria bacterium]|nr:ACP S-malonyltransferase [Gammaproteobacteria bacterium]
MTEISKKFAILFPGQGSQSVGMLADLAATFPIVQDTYAIASEVLGYDLWDLVQQGPVEKLNQTEYTQPALLAAEFAMWRIWQSMSPKDLPAYLAGHSLGEYSALVCAAAIDFKDAIALVAKRGQLMQQAVPEGKGAMVAIAGLDNDKILAVCKEAAQGQMLAPANYNSIGQT